MPAMLVERRAPRLVTLPEDVLLVLLTFMHVEDILALRMTAKYFTTVTKQRWVWSDAMKRHVIDKGLPVPALKSADIKGLSSRELESRAIHAARFHDNWSSAKPIPRNTLTFDATEPSHPDPPTDDATTSETCQDVKQVLFLPGHSGQLMVSVLESGITCWEVPLDGSKAFPVAHWTNGDSSPVSKVITNDHPDSLATLAVQVRDPNNQGLFVVVVLSLDTFHGCFKELGAFKGNGAVTHPLLYMYKDWVMFGTPVWVWSWRHPAQLHTIPSHQVPNVPESDPILCVKAIGGTHLLLVRQRIIQMIRTPLFQPNGSLLWPSCCHAAKRHIRNLAAIEAAIYLPPVHSDWAVTHPVHNPGHSNADALLQPMTILMRFIDQDTMQNTIHQVDLVLYPLLLEEGKPTNGLREWKVREFPVSPSCSQLYLGSSGKGFWMETRNTTTNHTTYPARCIVGIDISRNPRLPTLDEIEAPKEQRGRELTWADASNTVKICESMVEMRVGINEVARRRYRLTAAALDGSVGRIVVGNREGKVKVLDFA
ncbi:hypothetical protein JAAARDRAFT_159340 [Jaapia argillacea MUCL 33604]|uniref:F-box domain-containing protein n=1 Tax=Jaapia argillacea MUCL 33604 TaxID=933084 RepID=A0A067PLU2_9AGAM|nr:hypothetical protein JAAARDRAFT_159340 [Jaapia argillacea MUCL 33604]